MNKMPPRKEFEEDYQVHGLTGKELGEKYGFSRQTAFNYIKKWELVRKDREPWLKEFKLDYTIKGMTQKELMIKYGLSKSKVYQVVIREGIRHPSTLSNEHEKWCKRCRSFQSTSNFTRNSNVSLSTYCKPCMQSYRKKRSDDNIIKALEELSIPYYCVDCGYDGNKAAIDFHHENPEDKDLSIGQLRNHGYDKILNEMKSCVPLCRNCHKIRHNYKQNIKKKLLLMGGFDPKCTRCGEEDIRTLEFDHFSHTVKYKSPFTMAQQSYTKEEIIIELKKCRVLCANCHRAKTFPNN